MSSLKEKLTILVCTCDSYEDLWYPFFYLLDFYWPNLDCKIILNTETKSYSYKNLKIESYSFGPDLYGQRLLNHIKEVETPYLLLLLDDFFLRRPVDTEQLSKMIDFMDSDSEIAAMYCQESKYVEEKDSFSSFFRMNRYSPYKLNMQAAIWRISSLLNYWRPKDNPWIWEVFVNYLTFDNKEKFYCLKDLNSSPIFYGYNPDGMGVFRGKWVIEDVKPLFDEHGLIIDYSKRGIYKKETALSRFPVFKTMSYVFHRIPFRYAFMYSIFKIGNYLSVLCGFKKRSACKNYDEYLADKHMQG